MSLSFPLDPDVFYEEVFAPSYCYANNLLVS